MKKFNVLDWISIVLVIIGGINWGLIGLFRLNIVDAIFGNMTALSRIVYVIVGLAAVYLIFLMVRINKTNM